MNPATRRLTVLLALSAILPASAQTPPAKTSAPKPFDLLQGVRAHAAALQSAPIKAALTPPVSAANTPLPNVGNTTETSVVYAPGHPEK